jgi:hypothetical protein
MYGPAIAFEVSLFREPLTLTTLLGCVWLAGRWIERPAIWPMIAFSAVAVVGCYVRQNTGIIGPALVPFLFAHAGWRKGFVAATAAFVTAVVLIAPTTHRNWVHSEKWQHDFVDTIPPFILPNFARSLPESERANYLAATPSQQKAILHAAVEPEFVIMGLGSGMTFMAGNNKRWPHNYEPVYTDDLVGHGFAVQKTLAEEGRLGGASAWDRWQYERAWAHIREDPIWWMGHLWRKTVDLFGGHEHKRHRDLYLTRTFSPMLSATVWSYGLDFPWGVAGPLAAIGSGVILRRAWRTRRDPIARSRAFAAAVPVVFAIVYLVPFIFVAPCARYRYPAVVMLLPVAGLGARVLLRTSSMRLRVGALILAILINLPAPTRPANAPDDLWWLSYAYKTQSERAWIRGEYRASIDHAWHAYETTRRATEIDPNFKSAALRRWEMENTPTREQRAMWAARGGQPPPSERPGGTQ